MINLNNHFNTDLPFLDSIAKEVSEEFFSDQQFTIVCEKFEIEEDEAMELMLNSENYEFVRLSEGWVVVDKDKGENINGFRKTVKKI